MSCAAIAIAAAASHRSWASMNRSSRPAPRRCGSPCRPLRSPGRQVLLHRRPGPLQGAVGRGHAGLEQRRPSRPPASRARRGRSGRPAAAAAAPAARRGTRARSSPARRRPRPAASSLGATSSSSSSGYGWSHGTSANECSVVSRRDVRAEHVEADVGRDAVQPGPEQRAAVEACRGRATPAGTSPARRPRPRRTTRASGSSGRAARAGAARSAPRTPARRRHPVRPASLARLRLPVMPSARLAMDFSWTSQALPSGSLNDRNEP